MALRSRSGRLGLRLVLAGALLAPAGVVIAHSLERWQSASDLVRTRPSRASTDQIPSTRFHTDFDTPVTFGDRTRDHENVLLTQFHIQY